MTPNPTLTMPSLHIPSDETINAFYRAWFEENYRTPPATNASSAVTKAIKAALEHFGPELVQQG